MCNNKSGYDFFPLEFTLQQIPVAIVFFLELNLQMQRYEWEKNIFLLKILNAWDLRGMNTMKLPSQQGLIGDMLAWKRSLKIFIKSKWKSIKLDVMETGTV